MSPQSTKRPQREIQNHTADDVRARRALDAVIWLAALMIAGLIACALLGKSPVDVKEICLLLVRVVVEIAARR